MKTIRLKMNKESKEKSEQNIRKTVLCDVDF